ncbi:MAG: tetratricopeptide repeat protein, partial [Gammaproteobacteria bacterium]
MRTTSTQFVSGFAGVLLAASACADPHAEPLRDLFFGEALFYAEQGEYFKALERLDAELAQHYGVDEPELDSLQYHVNDAEFSVGDFELSYRMHHRAGRAITAVLEGDVAEEVRNEAAFRLARIHFQKGQFDDALRALNRIDGRVPEAIRDEISFLRANVLMAMERPGEAADTLRRLQSSDNLTGFAAYNLGIALLEDGRREDALQQLDRAGQVKVSDVGGRSIRDKANLVRGSLLMEDQDF